MCLNNKNEERNSRSDDAMLFRLQYTVDKLIFANARIEMFTISREPNHRKSFFDTNLPCLQGNTCTSPFRTNCQWAN